MEVIPFPRGPANISGNIEVSAEMEMVHLAAPAAPQCSPNNVSMYVVCVVFQKKWLEIQCVDMTACIGRMCEDICREILLDVHGEGRSDEVGW